MRARGAAGRGNARSDNGGMPFESGGLVLLLLGFAVAFIAGRLLGNKWRARRKEREVQAARAGESRQVRRARERQGKK